MTVSDPGAGQQQGREVCVCGHRPRDHDSGLDCMALSTPGQGRVYCPCLAFRLPAPSPTPPARDSGRAGCTCDAPLSSCTPGCPCTSCDALRDSGRNEAQSWRIIAMLKDLLPSVNHGGQVEHVRRFLHDEMTLAAADDSGRDEAREAVARWLARRDASPGAWDAQVKAGPVGERWCDRRRHDADELLALPELDKLLRRPA